MGNQKNRKGSSAKTRQARRNRRNKTSDHLDKENDPVQLKQQVGPEYSKISGIHSKQFLTVSQPRLPKSPPPWKSPDRTVEAPHTMQMHGLQIKNKQRVNFLPSSWRLPPARFGEIPTAITFRNTVRYNLVPSFDFGTPYGGFTLLPFGSSAVVPPNNLISKNTVSKQNYYDGCKIISEYGYYSTKSNAKRNQSENFMPPSSTAASARPNFKTNQNTEDDSDDVMYLYTVDTTSNGRIVEEVDLSTESVTVDLTATGSSKEISSLRYKREASNSQTQKPETVVSSNSPTGAKITSDQPKNPRKRKISENNGQPNKRASINPFQPRCCICAMKYDEVAEIKEYICIATGCGHLFCRPCICKSKKNCDICGIKVLSYRKVFL